MDLRSLPKLINIILPIGTILIIALLGSFAINAKKEIDYLVERR